MAAVLLVAVTAVTGKAAGVSNVKVYEPPYVAAKGQDVVRLASNPALKANPVLEADAYAAVSESVLWRFDVDDGLFPFSNLIADKWGNLYGTTVAGGSTLVVNPDCASISGCGTVFELSPPTSKSTQWTERMLWQLGAGSDGQIPTGSLIFDKEGNLYATTSGQPADSPRIPSHHRSRHQRWSSRRDCHANRRNGVRASCGASIPIVMTRRSLLPDCYPISGATFTERPTAVAARIIGERFLS